MQKIQPAPKIEMLLSEVRSNPDVMSRVLEASSQPIAGYRHWHKFKYLKPPEGLNSHQWWLATKISRNAAKRLLPLNDPHGNPFSYVLTDSILENLHRIDSEAGAKLGDAQHFDDAHGTQYMVMSLMEEAITSSQLEGALTTRKIASDMIRSGRSPTNRHEHMIFNNYRAMQHLQNSLSEPLTLDRLLHLHSILTTDTLDDPNDCGRVQTKAERRVMIADAQGKEFYHPPPAELLPSRLKDLIAFANQTPGEGQFLHPILRAIVLHFMIGFEHPFVDGNGRAARALFYYCALKHRYDAFAHISISRKIQQAPEQYSYAFQFVETDENDLTYFIHHQLEIICQSISDLKKFLQKKRSQISQVSKDLRKLSLNHRQLALISHAVNNPRHVYTIISHQNSHSCAYATSRADLLNLVDCTLLEKVNIDRKSLGFTAPENLAHRIARITNE